MTPIKFVDEIRKLHEPYLPIVIGVVSLDPSDPNYNGGEIHAPSIDERVDAMILWCDGCNTLAENCRIQHLLALVEDD